MWTDINSEESIVSGVLRHGLGVLEHCVADPLVLEQYLIRLDAERLNYPFPQDQIDPTNWLIPTSYNEIDIESWVLDQCNSQEEIERVTTELALYREHRMIPVLRAMKYIVDTLREHNIVWGVGRGSSVASYVLYIIGVHKIDSIKYNLPIDEFFKGEQNG